jgi:hypothetical protein
MNDFAQWGAIYYIDGAEALQFHGAESIVMPWGLSDKPNRLPLPSVDLATYPMREFSETDDATSMVNDAFVWGGSEFAGVSGGTVFSRKTNPDSIDAHNLWQFSEVDIGSLKVQSEVTARANKIVFGSTDAGTGEESGYGLSRVQSLVSCVWFAHDVPKIDGVPQHIKPGYVVPMVIYTYGTDADHPLILNLPLRSANISFPDLDPEGNPYIKFEGQFGLQLSDPHWLWIYLLKLGNKPLPSPLAITNDDSHSTVYGAIGTFDFPTIEEGQTVFTLPFGYIPGTTQFYLNGLLQRLGVDYYETDPINGVLTFSEGLCGTGGETASDAVVVECRTVP